MSWDNFDFLGQSGDVSMIFSSEDKSSREKSVKHEESDELDFKATLRDVQSLGRLTCVCT